MFTTANAPFSTRSRRHVSTQTTHEDLEKRLLDAATAIQQALDVVRVATTTPTASDSRIACLEQQFASLQVSNDKLQQRIAAFDTALDALSSDLENVRSNEETNLTALDDLWLEIEDVRGELDAARFPVSTDDELALDETEATPMGSTTDEGGDEEDESLVMVPGIHICGLSPQTTKSGL